MSSPLPRRPTAAPSLVRHLAAAVTVLGVAGVFVATAPGAQAATGPLQLTGTNGGGFAGSAGDFNGDGKSDLLYSSSDGTTVTVVYGTSPVQTGIDVSANLGTRAIRFTAPSGRTILGASAAGDVDHDGRADIVVVTDTVDFIVYGTASGAGTSTPLAAGTGMTSITRRALGNTFGAVTTNNGAPLATQTYGIGDFNGDGYGDVKIASGGVGASIVYGGPRVTSINATAQAARVSLIDGQKNCGVIQGILKVCQNQPIDGFAAGDFNGDGKDDLVVAQFNGVPQLLLGRTGSFTLAAGATSAPSVQLPIIASPLKTSLNVAGVGDVNGDHFDDIGIADGSILLGRANPPATIAAGAPVIKLVSPSQAANNLQPQVQAIGVGDQNGDGKDDVLAFTPQAGPRLVTSLPDAGTTVNIETLPTIGGIPSVNLVPSAAGVDFDGDGAPDAAFTDLAKTYVLSHQAAAPPSPTPTPPAGPYPATLGNPGWVAFVGAPTVLGVGTVELGHAPNIVSSLTWNSATDYRNKTIAFDVTMAGGTGGEGMTLGFVNPAADGSFPSTPGGFPPGQNTLGFGYFSGLALALDVTQGTGDPSANELGFVDGGANDALHWLKVAPAPVPLYGAGVVHVKLVLQNGIAAVFINGRIARGGGEFAPAARSYLTFTAATSNANWQATTISNFSVTDS